MCGSPCFPSGASSVEVRGERQLSAGDGRPGARSDPLRQRTDPAGPDEAVVPQGYTVVNVPRPASAAVQGRTNWTTWVLMRVVWTDGGVPDHRIWRTPTSGCRVSPPNMAPCPPGPDRADVPMAWAGAKVQAPEPNWENPCPPCHLGGGNLHRGSVRTRPAQPASHRTSVVPQGIDLQSSPPRARLLRRRAPATL